MEAMPQDNVLSGSGPIPPEYSIGSTERQSVVATSNIYPPVRTLFDHSEYPILFRGIGLTLDKKNEYVFPVLEGSAQTKASDENV
jgi:hypothetical protein